MVSIDRSFAAARLPLELRTVPLDGDRFQGVERVVQMDIARANDPRPGKPERFRIYPGVANDLAVLNASARKRQLVLRVVEHADAFTQWVRADRVPAGVEILARDGKRVQVLHKTSSEERTFLLGMDERHLFIALMPRPVSTVREAHEALRPAIVDRLSAAGASVKRQGEWFFLTIPDDEVAWVDALAKRTLRVARNVGIAEAIGLQRLGRPHVAEEIVVVRGIPALDGDRAERVYVRGRVVHPDHATVRFDVWRRTVVNEERLEAPVPGVDWFD